jgi:nitroreductase
MTLYETIFKRRSVRRYLDERLNQEELSGVWEYLNSIEQLSGYKAEFRLETAENVSGKKAPHYIFAYCKERTGDYINVGYTLEKLDLYLQSVGLGSLWLGMANPKGKEAKEDYAIMLAFGKTNEPLRNGEKDFSRLKTKDISNEVNPIANAARLAPSAVNDQPWHLNFEAGKIAVSYEGHGILRFVLKRKMSKFDVGIVTRFIELALENEGKSVKEIKVNEGDIYGVEISFD